MVTRENPQDDEGEDQEMDEEDQELEDEYYDSLVQEAVRGPHDRVDDTRSVQAEAGSEASVDDHDYFWRMGEYAPRGPRQEQ